MAMRRLKRGIIIFFIVIAVLIIGLGLFKNPLIKSVVTNSATRVIGVPVHMDAFSLSLLNQSVRIKGFTVYNPEGFPANDVLLYAPEISVDCDVNTLMGGKLHLPYVAFNLKEMVIIRNKEGKLNIDVIREALGQKEPSEKEEEPEVPEEPTEPMEMQIDVLKLTVGKVIYKDYSMGDKPAVINLDVDIKDKTYRDITSAQQVGIIVLKEVVGYKIVKDTVFKGVASAIDVEQKMEDITKTAGNVLFDTGKKFLGKEDDRGIDFNVGYDKIYQVILKTIQEMGEVTKDDKDSGVVKAKVDGSDVTVEISKKGTEKVQVKVSAKKFMIPKPEVAKEILSKITENL